MAGAAAAAGRTGTTCRRTSRRPPLRPQRAVPQRERVVVKGMTCRRTNLRVRLPVPLAVVEDVRGDLGQTFPRTSPPRPGVLRVKEGGGQERPGLVLAHRTNRLAVPISRRLP